LPSIENVDDAVREDAIEAGYGIGMADDRPPE